MRWVSVGLAALASAACGEGAIVPTEVVLVDYDADGNEVLTRLVTLNVSPGPVYAWNGETVTLEEIEQRLVALKEAEASADPRVTTYPRIEVDPAADFADTAKLLALIQKHGLEKWGVFGGL